MKVTDKDVAGIWNGKFKPKESFRSEIKAKFRRKILKNLKNISALKTYSDTNKIIIY